jgi:hypothetical protein
MNNEQSTVDFFYVVIAQGSPVQTLPRRARKDGRRMEN